MSVPDTLHSKKQEVQFWLSLWFECKQCLSKTQVLVKTLVSRMAPCRGVGPLGVVPSRRSVSHWRHDLEGDHGTLVFSFLS